MNARQMPFYPLACMTVALQVHTLVHSLQGRRSSSWVCASDDAACAPGVYDEPACSETELDHAVMLVGYGTDAASGKDFWLIKARGRPACAAGRLCVARVPCQLAVTQKA